MKRILIQHCRTKRFLSGTHEWTPNAQEALDFQTNLNAIACCLERRLPSAQVVVQEAPGEEPIVVPVGEEACRLIALTNGMAPAASVFAARDSRPDHTISGRE